MSNEHPDMHGNWADGPDDDETPVETATHTPGPWAHGPAFANSQHVILANAPDGFSFNLAFLTGTYEERAANARLIAAAPELLNALRITIAKLSEHIPKEARGYAEGCFKYVMGGIDICNCDCPICVGRRAIINATEGH